MSTRDVGIQNRLHYSVLKTVGLEQFYFISNQ